MIKNFLNPERHQNPISGSKVTAILLKGWILPIGGASWGEGLRLQPVQQACFWYRQVDKALRVRKGLVENSGVAAPGNISNSEYLVRNQVQASLQSNKRLKAKHFVEYFWLGMTLRPKGSRNLF